jgi:hypothetical protein
MADRKVRIRSKRLSQIDESKFQFAVWLMIRDIADEAELDKQLPKPSDSPTSRKETA